MDLATRKMVYYGLLGLIIAGSTITVFRVTPQVVPVQFLAKDGTFAVYFSSIPSDIQSNPSGSTLVAVQGLELNLPTHQIIPVSVNVTIDSISLHDNEGNDSGWTTDSLSMPMTIDLLQSTAVSTLIGTEKIPAQNVTMIVLHVSKAVASISVNGVLSTSPVQVSVPSDTLKIPIGSGAIVDPQRTTKVVAVRPHIVVAGISGMVKITPVLQVDTISGPE
jgi:Domain of unknown function (DUF4382)